MCGNFSPHRKAEVTATGCDDNDVELVLTPSNASWLNRIESEFAPLRHFTLQGSDHPDHATQEATVEAINEACAKDPEPRGGSLTRAPSYTGHTQRHGVGICEALAQRLLERRPALSDAKSSAIVDVISPD